MYDLKMETATIIPKSAMILMIQSPSLEMIGFENVEYYQIVCPLSEKYRLLFIDWLSKFD